MALLSKTKAIRLLRTETGLSERSCEGHVERMATVKDGKRLKVHDHALRAFITKFNAPVQVRGVRPLSDKQVARIRAQFQEV